MGAAHRLEGREGAVALEGLRELIAHQLPGGATLRSAAPLRPDEAIGIGEGPTKALGYGAPILLTLELPDGGEQRLVFRTATPNPFGHDRRSDRAAELLQAQEDFAVIPRHARTLDVGAITSQGQLSTLRDATELYLITEYVEGSVYAQDLRRIAHEGYLLDQDLSRVSALASYLAELHQTRATAAQHRRSVRDLVGGGEGIFGLIDGYPDHTPGAPPSRLRALEHACLDWRWRLHSFEHRAARIHGDFHPFNILFRDGEDFTLLDAARGCAGDPADDVTALAVNFPFFAIDSAHGWRGGLRELWQTFWAQYLRERRDPELLLVVPPYLAWRLLVVCSPLFYPTLSAQGRDRLLSLAERSLAAERFDPHFAEELFP